MVLVLTMITILQRSELEGWELDAHLLEVIAQTAICQPTAQEQHPVPVLNASYGVQPEEVSITLLGEQGIEDDQPGHPSVGKGSRIHAIERRLNKG